MFNFKKINEAFIIAEAGVNHEGSLKEALKLVKNAKKSGAHAIKFQTYNSELYVSESQKERLERVKRFELSYKQFEELLKECKKNKIIFFSTPLDKKSVDFLSNKVPFFKISSGDITNYPLIKYIAKKNKPIILSTGGATIDEIDKAINTIKRYTNISLDKYLCIMHCVTLYPTLPSDADLLNIKLLQEKYNFTIGYSDHTIGLQAPLIARILGAKIIEKHFTNSRKNKSFHDHHISVNPKELNELIKMINNFESYLGNSSRIITKKIKKNLPYLRRSYALKENKKKNHKIGQNDLILLRPATGFSTLQRNKIVGKRLRKDFNSHLIIKKNNLL